MTAATLQQIRERLAAQAFLFDDPRAYAAGAEDAIAELLDGRELSTTGHA